RNLPYLGFGAGAHGCAQGWRYANVLSPQAYLRRLQQDAPALPPCSAACAERVQVDRPTEMDETMLLGFRLTGEGIRPSGFQARFGEEVEARYGPRLRRLESDGLIERSANRLRLTRRGRLLGNRVFEAFV
ncbi:MAG TPA: hypothetical protein VK449_05725, partial [Anaerolineales bacterium]|nr:hypothetical protein [Anaerolineales bacterium]